jgi:hypothetical protein
LVQVSAAFEQHPDLARIAVDPFMPIKTKTNIVKALFEGSQATEITKRLFGAQLSSCGGRSCC